MWIFILIFTDKAHKNAEDLEFIGARQDICHLSLLDVEHFCEFNLVRFSPLPRAQ